MAQTGELEAEAGSWELEAGSWKLEAGSWFSRPSQLPREVAQVQPGHLVLQGAEWNAEITRRGGHVPVRLFERAQDEVALEGIACFLKKRFPRSGSGVELGEV